MRVFLLKRLLIWLNYWDPLGQTSDQPSNNPTPIFRVSDLLHWTIRHYFRGKHYCYVMLYRLYSDLRSWWDSLQRQDAQVVSNAFSLKMDPNNFTLTCFCKCFCNFQRNTPHATMHRTLLWDWCTASLPLDVIISWRAVLASVLRPIQNVTEAYNVFVLPLKMLNHE